MPTNETKRNVTALLSQIPGFALGNVQRGGEMIRRAVQGNPDPNVLMGDPSMGMGSAAAPFFLKRLPRYGSLIPETKLATYNAYLPGKTDPFGELIVAPARKRGEIKELLPQAEKLEVSIINKGPNELERAAGLPDPMKNTKMIRAGLQFLATAYPKTKKIVGNRLGGMAPGHGFKANAERLREGLTEETRQQILSDILKGVERRY